jgi:hypothetical protein
MFLKLPSCAWLVIIIKISGTWTTHEFTNYGCRHYSDFELILHGNQKFAIMLFLGQINC